MNTSISIRRPAIPSGEGLSTLGTRLKAWALRAVGVTAAESNAAESVRELIALADSYEETQPSFAADLRAAALAHEHA